MICRIEFRDGVDMPANAGRLDAYMGGLVLANFEDLRPLPIGTHVVTPETWTGHMYEHEVTVLDNGQAVYRMIPRRDDSSFQGTEDITQSTLVTLGASERRINPDLPAVIISGMHTKKRSLQIFGALFYIAER